MGKVLVFLFCLILCSPKACDFDRYRTNNEGTGFPARPPKCPKVTCFRPNTKFVLGKIDSEKVTHKGLADEIIPLTQVVQKSRKLVLQLH